MKTKLFISLILLFFYQSLFAQEKTKMEIINQLIQEVKTEFAPDKRVAIFNIDPQEEKGYFLIAGETNIPKAKEKFMEKIKSLNIDVLDEIKLLPHDNLGNKIYGIVNISVANIRSYADHPAELATQSLLGTPLRVFKENEGWYLVQTPDEYISWLDEDGLVLVDEVQYKEWIKAKKIIYLNDFGFVYFEMNEQSKRVSDLVAGNLLKFVDEKGDYYQVQFPDGRSGYVKKSESIVFDDWLKNISVSEESIITTAERFMGVPYLWGGTSPKGMDCSGFSKTVYFLNGIIIPRDASQQVFTGELVDTENGFDNLKPGDLLFFGSRATKDRTERVTHVAIYVGDGVYIHASGKVKLNSLRKDSPIFSQYRLNSFIRAKRILGSFDQNGIRQIKKCKFYSAAK